MIQEEQPRAYHYPLSARQGAMAQSPSTTRLASKGMGISGYPKSPKTAVTVTPTSTPPIRVSPSTRRNMMSPSPLTTQAQKQYYEDSTWRMYDRIQASRSAPTANKQYLIPPVSRPTSSMASMPRYSQPYDKSHRLASEEAGEGSDVVVDDHDDDEELIFDLEL